ncbi:UdgX family uracil-DNA binding protein [Indioceanicola profundi]|uniref:UdgX family uracil-DNA binding protein n=1 Tax=Indioceanicola profundi TaxID=2220096 RepID=UPI000E6AC67E|nr:UdgX family uracil-DNA binding protein [Indioceanicola profundi]
MYAVPLDGPVDLAGWRTAARRLVLAGVEPAAVDWRPDGGAGLFGDALPPEPTAAGGFTVPRRFLELADAVVCHRDPERFGLLYRLLWRLAKEEPALLEISSDRDVHRAMALEKAVRRDEHKMHAFVRFRERDGHYLAWFEPDHHIVERAAPFFARRFASMRWSILTPERSAHWDGDTLHFTPGARRADVPDEDALEAYWQSYYASIFNPARLKVAAMRSEMPKKYWRNLPEAQLITPLVRGAAARAAEMVATVPSLPAARAERWGCGAMPDRSGTEGGLQACRRCPLWQPATQAVPGEGPPNAALMLVGEQPGDQEDLAGRPFVGPAGQVLDRALAEAGIVRADAYLTNAVKHFKFTPRGKRRIHQKPDAGEIESCRWWLEEEIRTVRPRLIVALGATAGRALLGREVKVQQERGRMMEIGEGRRLLLTVHPSYLLRLPDEAAKVREYARFVEDLRMAAQVGPA